MRGKKGGEGIEVRMILTLFLAVLMLIVLVPSWFLFRALEMLPVYYGVLVWEAAVSACWLLLVWGTNFFAG